MMGAHDLTFTPDMFSLSDRDWQQSTETLKQLAEVYKNGKPKTSNP